MDISVLEPIIPKDKETPEEQKYDAFYASSIVAPPDLVENTYDEVLGELTRFGKSPLIDSLKEEQKKRQEVESNSNIEAILLSPSLSIEEKRAKVQESVIASQNPVKIKDSYARSIKNMTGKVVEKPKEVAWFSADHLNKTLSALKREVGGYVDLQKSLFKGVQGLDKYEEGYDYGSVLPFRINTKTKEKEFAVPSILKDLAKAFTAPSRASKGEIDVTSDEGMHEAVNAAFSISIPPVAGVTAKAVSKAVTPKSPFDKGVRIEPTIGPVETPIDVVTSINKQEAANILARSVNSPKMADAIGTTPNKIVNKNLLPKVDENIGQIFPDIADDLARKDAEFMYLYDLGKVDPFLYDTTAISKDLDKYNSVISSTTNKLRLNIASSISDVDITQAGPVLKGDFKFGVAPNKGFERSVEGIIQAERAKADLVKQVSIQFKIPLKEAKKSVDLVSDPKTGDIYLSWKVNQKYDPRIDTTMTAKAIEAKFAGMDVTSFANNPIGEIFFNPRNRMSQAYSTGMALSTIRGNNFGKTIERMLFKDIVKNPSQPEIATAIKLGDEKRTEFTVKDLKDMFPDLPPSRFKDLVKGYSTFRRVADYDYFLADDIYRGSKVAAGYTGLYDEAGRPIASLGREVKKPSDSIDTTTGLIAKGQKDITNSAGEPVTKVFDFSLKKEEGEVGSYKGPVDISTINVDTATIFKLDRPIKKDGVVYEYGIGAVTGPVKQNLLPKIVGYYPHNNMEHYFVKAEPKELNLGGKVVTKDPKDKKSLQLYKDHSSTVGFGRTMAEAEQLAAKLQTENKDSGFTYIAVNDRSAFDDTLFTAMESVRAGDDLARSRGETRLKDISGKESRLQDPLLSLKNRFDQVAKMYSWRDLDLEFRKNFLEEFEELIGGVFPKSASDITIDHLPDTPVNRAKLLRARRLYEQYSKQQGQIASMADNAWQSAIHSVADFVEAKTPKFPILEPISDKLQEISTTKNPITKYLLKGTTAFYMHWNVLRQLFIQPSPIVDLHGLATLNGNTRFLAESPVLIPKLFWHTIASKMGVRMSDKAKQIADEALAKELGVPLKEMQKIYAAFGNSGIGNSIDLSALTEGVFAKNIHTLAETELGRVAKKGARGAQGVVNLPKVVGYDSGELLNQIGAWVYARSDFIKKNPNADWFETTNQAKIHGFQWEISNSMTTAADKFSYQDGMFRFLTQFIAATNKSVMQPFVAPYLARDEKIKLAAARLALYGKKGTFLGGTAYLLGDYLIDDDTVSDETKDKLSRGGVDALTNATLRYMFDDDPTKPKTDLLFSESMGPGGEFGIPFDRLAISMWEFTRGERKVDNLLPFLGATNAVSDTANELYDIFSATKYEDMDAQATARYIMKGAEVAKGWDNARQAMLMAHFGTLVDKQGNPRDLEVTYTEAMAKFFGVSDARSVALNEMNKKSFNWNRQIEKDAKEILQSLHAIEDVYSSNAAPEDIASRVLEERTRINYLISIYDKNGERSEELIEAIYKEKDSVIRGKGGLQSLTDRIYKKHSEKYKKDVQDSLSAIAESGSEENKRLVKRMFEDIEGKE